MKIVIAKDRDAFDMWLDKALERFIQIFDEQDRKEAERQKRRYDVLARQRRAAAKTKNGLKERRNAG